MARDPNGQAPALDVPIISPPDIDVIIYTTISIANINLIFLCLSIRFEFCLARFLLKIVLVLNQVKLKKRNLIEVFEWLLDC